MDSKRGKEFLQGMGFEELPDEAISPVLKSLRRQINSILSDNIYDVKEFKLDKGE